MRVSHEEAFHVRIAGGMEDGYVPSMQHSGLRTRFWMIPALDHWEKDIIGNSDSAAEEYMVSVPCVGDVCTNRPCLCSESEPQLDPKSSQAGHEPISCFSRAFLWFYEGATIGIYPDSAFRTTWDCIILTLLLWISVSLPYLIAFDVSMDVGTPLGVLDLTQDCLFWTDIMCAS